VATLAVVRPSGQQVGRAVVPPGAEPLTVDFLAVSNDDARTPILDLTKEAVTLKVGGRRRVITNLQLVEANGSPTGRTPAAAATATSAFPSPFATNVDVVGSGLGRRVVFVVDTDSIRPGQEGPLRAAVMGFLTRLGPHDQVGVLAVPHGGLNVELTGQLDRVRNAFNRLSGTALASQTTPQASGALLALTAMLRGMSGSEYPTTIIYLASSLMAPTGPQTFAMFNLVRETVGAARAQVFSVQIEGGLIIPAAAAGTASNGLASLASVGGGEFFGHLALGEEDAIARIERETSAYYVATFGADPSDRFNTRYPIALNSSRADVRFVARPDFERVGPASNTGPPMPGDMLKSAGGFRGLPLRAVGYSVRPVGVDRNRLTWVRALAEIATPGRTLTAASAGLYAATGQMVAKYDLPLTDLAKPVLQALLAAPPGQYRLRFAATDGKRSGAVDYPIDVGLTPAGSFKLSSLMIEPKLQFSSEAEASAVLELYGQNTGQQLSIEVLLEGAGSEPKPLASPKILPTSPEADRYSVRIPIPLADLPPGDYQVRVTAGVVGEPAGTLTATVRKVK
jgi:hypothetical protein